ncbi:MAG TPA: hypothetical protein EYO33_13205 [Phycisphaerales bacterium]|nr:hypothetical protein [Phycisphaerales bacterium]
MKPEDTHELTSDLRMELQNKIRWAIGTTIGTTQEFNLPYRAQVILARNLAEDCFMVCREAVESLNGALSSPEGFEKLLKNVLKGD